MIRGAALHRARQPGSPAVGRSNGTRTQSSSATRRTRSREAYHRRRIDTRTRHGPVHGHRGLHRRDGSQPVISEWRDVIERHHCDCPARSRALRGRLIKTLGDGILATFDGPARAIRCAAALREQARSTGIELRAGLHTGEIEIIGDDIAGIAASIGARVAALAGEGEILVSSTVKDLVAGSGIAFADRGATSSRACRASGASSKSLRSNAHPPIAAKRPK